MGKEVEKIKNKPAMVLYIFVALLFGGLFGCWLRILDVLAGRTVFTLAVFSGIALAGAVAGVVSALIGGRRKSVESAFFCALFLAAAVYHVFLMRAAGGIAASWQNLFLDTSRDFNLYFRLLFKSSAIFVLVFGMLAGSAIARALRKKDLMFTFSWAIPGVLVFLAGWWTFGGLVVDLAGMGGSLRLLPGLLGLAAAAALLTGDKPQRFAALAVAVLAAAAYVYIIPLKVDMILSKGTFGRLVYRDSGFAFGDPVEEYNSLSHAAYVYHDRDYQFVFELDNRPLMFGSRFHTSRTLNAYIPLLMCPESEKVLVLGTEAGFYVPFYSRAGVPDLHVSQVDDSILEACWKKDCIVSGTPESDIRSLPHNDLSGKYDLVVLAPEPLYMRGSAGSCSRNMFVKAARALNENGSVALHVDARALTREDFSAIVAGMRKVFPHMQVWSTGVYEWMLIGACKPLTIEADKTLALFEKDAVFKDFIRAGKLTLPDAMACMICDETGVDQWLGQNRDCTPLWKISWNAPKSVFNGMAGIMTPVLFEKCRQLSIVKWFVRGGMDDETYKLLIARVEKNISARISSVMAFANMVGEKPEDALRCACDAAALNPRDALLVQYAETLELEGRRRIAIGDYKGAVRCYENILSFNPDSPQAHYGLGYCMRANGDTQNAYIHFARSVVGAPWQVNYRLEFAEVALSVGEFKMADLQYEKVLERNPDDAQTMMLYAKALIYKGREDRNPEKAVALARKACEITGWRVEKAVVGLADIYIESGRVMEGMGLKRRLKEGGILRMKDEG